MDEGALVDDTVPACVLCFESHNDDNQLLLAHKCPICAKGAWRICERCDEYLLSRQCPVCRSDYEPLTYYKVEGPPLSDIIMNPNLSHEERLQLSKTIVFIKRVIESINVAVWDPIHSHLLISFYGADSGDLQIRQQCCIGMIRIHPDQIQDGEFLFSNKTWDDFIEQSETQESADEICTIVGTGSAFKMIFEATKIPGSILFTPFHPSYLATM